MKLNVKTLTFALVLGIVTTTATVRVFAQDEKTQQTEKQDEKDEYKKPEPAKWMTVPHANLKIGFAKEWEIQAPEGADEVQAASEDAGVRFFAYVAKVNSEDGTSSRFTTLDETYSSLKKDLEGHYTDLKLTDPKHSRECHGLKVIDTGGTGKQKDGREVDIAVDLIESDGKVIVVQISAAHDSIEKHFADIILAQESYQKAKPDADKDK